MRNSDKARTMRSIFIKNTDSTPRRSRGPRDRCCKVASVRYIVKDVDASVKFYTELLGFELKQKFGPAMAIVAHGDLTLWLAGPVSSAAQPMPDGRKPEPGSGWNRFVLQVNNLPAL